MATPAIRSMRVLVLTTALLAAAACGQGSQGTAPTSPATTGPAASSPAPTSPSSSPSGSPSESACAQPTHSAAIYYVSDVPSVGPRLYREFAKVGSCQDAITEALQQMFSGQPTDPDYHSLWPEGTSVLSVKRAGATATIDVSDFVAVGASFESASVQQLVWTATAADRTVRTVRLLVNGATPPSGHSDWNGPLTRDNAIDTLANVWILQPTQGATVSSPVKVHVYGTGYEGNVILKVFSGGSLVATTSVTTMMGGFAEAGTTIKLPAGTYVLKSYTDNGRNAKLQLWDTKDFTVS